MNGPCANATVRCTLITPSGERFVGENWCGNPQPACPRAPGEGYDKCKSICRQEGHAEAVAVRIAGEKARGAHAYLEGHTYACMDCQHTLFGAGVESLSVRRPPSPTPPSLDTPVSDTPQSSKSPSAVTRNSNTRE